MAKDDLYSYQNWFGHTHFVGINAWRKVRRGDVGNEACHFYSPKQAFPQKGSLIIRIHEPERHLDIEREIDIDNGLYAAGR